jgi:hypothetical protein
LSRARGCRLVGSGILDEFEHCDRLPGIVLDLPDIKGGRMAGEGGVAMERCAGEDALQFFRGGHGFVAKGRGYPFGSVAAERVYGKIDAETFFGAINEFLAEVGADVDICEGLAVADNRRHTEYAQQLPPGFNADDLSAGPERLHHGVAAT